MRIRRDSLIAAGGTIVAASLLFCFLYFGSVRFDLREAALASTPEIGLEEELFLSPELAEPGVDERDAEPGETPMMQGDAEPGERSEPEVKRGSERPSPQREKLNTGKREEDVKSAEPAARESETRKAQGRVANAFPDSGHGWGRDNSSGSGGNSVGVSGNANGWKLIEAPHPKVAVSSRVVIEVDITVNAEGRVISAKASKGGNAGQRRACEEAAMRASWQPLNNSRRSTARGRITYTIKLS